MQQHTAHYIVIKLYFLDFHLCCSKEFVFASLIKKDSFKAFTKINTGQKFIFEMKNKFKKFFLNIFAFFYKIIKKYNTSLMYTLSYIFSKSE